MMHHVLQPGLTAHAVAGQLERRVRPARGGQRTGCPTQDDRTALYLSWAPGARRAPPAGGQTNLPAALLRRAKAAACCWWSTTCATSKPRP